MWSSVVYEEKKANPVARSKHSITLVGGHLYLLAGRNGNLPLKDFWKYDLCKNTWELINAKGDIPPCLQEHTAFTFKENIYVFGGEVGFSAGNETPLWIYQTKLNTWRKISAQKGANVPKGRRSHTTLVHHGSALVYGGYCDLRGSSNELWVFHFETESWHLLVNGRNDPPGRHKHSAVMHEHGMWIYGGMTDLQERSDLCRFDIGTKKWSTIKCKTNPGTLHSHSVCKLHNSMLLFGGERNGHLSNELWKFHFGAETWERIYTDTYCPQPLSECQAVTVPIFLMQETNDLQTNIVANENDPPLLVRKESGQSTDNVMKSRHMNSCDIFGTRYVAERRTVGQGMMVPPRRQATTPNSCNLNILREISKLSHMNLSLLTGGTNGSKRCSYRTLHSNSSESIDNILEEETTNSQLSGNLKPTMTATCNGRRMATSVSSLKSPHTPSYGNNTLLTPVEVTKLVYLDDEQAPSVLTETHKEDDDGTDIKEYCEEFSLVPHRRHGTGTVNNKNNRRSYPMAMGNSVRFANPLVTPEEPQNFANSDYISCENIHKLTFTTGKSKTPVDVPTPISFSNPNYLNVMNNENGFSRNGYTKLLDHNLDDRNATKYVEMVEMRPMPPKSLPLLNCANASSAISEKQKRYRACSAERYNEINSRNNLCVFIVGGRDNHRVTVFKQPISMWKLSFNERLF